MLEFVNASSFSSAAIELRTILCFRGFDSAFKMKSFTEQARELATPEHTEESAFYFLLGFKVRQARQKRKLQQKELAQLIGVSQSCLARIEIGESRAQVYDLVQISKVLKIKLMELIPC